jgi:Uma2 family endonuclease
MMNTRTLIPVEEYLATVYRPDCDYVDGEVQERNLGERDHSYVQVALGSYLFSRRKALGIEVYPEQRVQVRANRYRIPDLCVVVGSTKENILTRPPFLCIEILSPEDRMSRVQERIDDYFAMGVAHVWVVDPQTRRAYEATAAEGLREVKAAVLRTSNPVIEVPLAEIFEP